MWKTGRRAATGGCLGCLVALIILGMPGIGHAYTYQNKEFRFKIDCPQQPLKVVPLTDAPEKGVALNFSENEANINLWLIQIRPGDFVDPRQLSEAEVQEVMAELKKTDYGDGKILDSSELVDVGKYQGILLLLHDAETRLAISMVKTDGGTFLLSLVGSLQDKADFDRNLLLYKKGIATFANL